MPAYDFLVCLPGAPLADQVQGACPAGTHMMLTTGVLLTETQATGLLQAAEPFSGAVAAGYLMAGLLIVPFLYMLARPIVTVVHFVRDSF